MRYVPEVKMNVLSISMFNQIGFITKIEQWVIKIIRGDSTIVRGRKRMTCTS